MKIPNLKVYQPVYSVSDAIIVPRFAKCELHDDEEPIQNDLAFTPSKMLMLAHDGVPISTQTAGMVFDDGYRTLDFEPLLEHQRGIDMAELWEHDQDARGKFKSAIKKARESQKGVE